MNEIEYVESINTTRPYHHVTEQQLAEAMARADDDPAAWREFRARYTADVLSFIHYSSHDLLDEDTAVDRLREFEVHVLRGIGRFHAKHDGSLKSWSLKIASRVVLDYLRRERHAEAFVSIEEIEHELAGETSPEFGPRPRTAREQTVHDAMATLTADEQTVIWLHVNTDWADKDVARHIGRPDNQVRQFRARAIAKLRKLVGVPVRKRTR